MGAGASMQLDPAWSETDLNRISATLASVCEPEVLRKVAKSLLEEESKGRAEIQDVKGLLYELANSVHQHKGDIDIQSEEIQALNLMLFDFIDVVFNFEQSTQSTVSQSRINPKQNTHFRFKSWNCIKIN